MFGWCLFILACFEHNYVKELEKQKSSAKTVDAVTDIGVTGKTDGKAGIKVSFFPSLQFLTDYGFSFIHWLVKMDLIWMIKKSTLLLSSTQWFHHIFWLRKTKN